VKGYPYRPALDGVRALAVTAVLLFHGGVGWLPGGFLGVDAFFVLSGFLITSLLLAEHARYGWVRLSAFWLRRARRLLPALVVVLVVVVACFRDLLPVEELGLLRGDAMAALAYVANWRMIYRGDDYFTQSASPSPLQHTWSLGIEEQFYLVWPLAVVAVLAYAVTRRRAILIGLCAAGVVASLILAAALFDPADVGRVYFGTDTRAGGLLIGCAVAVLLPGGDRAPRWAVDGTRNAAVVGVVALAWLWTSAHGADPWLYRGGLLVGALAVVAVIAHAVLSPDAPLGRALAVPALVWLGRVSYGVYLWHWPVYGLLNADRTGLTGAALLVVRLGTTVAVAAASYVLIEQPVRTGRWPWATLRLPATGWSRRLPRTSPHVTPLAAGLAATATLCATAAYIVVGTVAPPDIDPGVPVVAAPTGPPAGSEGDRPPPIKRAGRKAGAEPRITFLGDSVSWSLGHYLPTQPGLQVTVRAIQGCGIARLPDLKLRGEVHTNYPACPTWDARWRRGITADDPDVAVILLDRWELTDRRLGDEYRHVGQPDYDLYLGLELELAISVAGRRGAHVVLLTAPYTRRAERWDGGLYDEDLPERVDAWNRLLREVAARHPDTVSVIDLNAHVCPDGRFTWTIGDLRIRSDGLHFTPEGVRRWIAPWLLPQLLNIATG
jgi:peptidoglycan/LPS O-acetylase OafA/YrhL